MSKKTVFLRKCTRCEQQLPINAFSVRNKITSPFCLNCEALAEAEGQGGGGGPKLHKDYYSEHREHGNKSQRNVQSEQHLEDKEAKSLVEDDKKQDKKDELKQKKVTSFLNRLRDTKSLFSAGAAKTTTPVTREQTRDFLAASEYIKGQHDTNASVIDPSGVRAAISRSHWEAHSGAVRSWATSAAVQSHTQKSSAMINPYNTWQRRAMLGASDTAGKASEKTANKNTESAQEDNAAEKQIQSWSHRSGKK